MLFIWAVTATVVAGFFAVLAYGAWMGRGQIEATAVWRTEERDKAYADRAEAEKEVAELKAKLCKKDKELIQSRAETQSQVVIIGQLKAELEEAQKDRDEGWGRVKQMVGVGQKAKG